MGPWTAVRQASLSITNSRSLRKLMSIKSVMPSNQLILCHPLVVLLSIFLCISAFSMESVGRRQWHPTPVLLPGKSNGQRSLVGCSPRGREESDTAEQLHFHFLMLGKIEGRRRRGHQRLRWLDGTTYAMKMNLGKTSSDISCSSIFLDQSPKAREIKIKINK